MGQVPAELAAGEGLVDAGVPGVTAGEGLLVTGVAGVTAGEGLVVTGVAGAAGLEVVQEPAVQAKADWLQTVPAPQLCRYVTPSAHCTNFVQSQGLA